MNSMRRSLPLILLLLLSPLAPVARGRAGFALQGALRADEAELRGLATRYAMALSANDERELAQMLADSSEFLNRWRISVAERYEAWQGLVSSSTRVALHGFKVEKVVLGGTAEGLALFGKDPERRSIGSPPPRKNRAVVFLSLSVRAFDAKTGAPRAELLNMRRVIECAKVSPGYRFGEKRVQRTFSDISYQEEKLIWLVVGDEPDLKHLSGEVLHAKTEREARAYLRPENTEALRRLTPEVVKRATSYFEQEDYERGLHALRTAQAIAEEIEAKTQQTEKLKARAKAEEVLKNIEGTKKRLAEDRERLAKERELPADPNWGLERKGKPRRRIPPPPVVDDPEEPDQSEATTPEQRARVLANWKIHLADEIAENLSRLGRYHSEADQPDEALKYFGQSLAEYEKLGNKRMMADMLEEMGRVYLNQNDDARALEHWMRSWRLGLEGEEAKDAAIAAGTFDPRRTGSYSFSFEDGVPSRAVGQFNGAFMGSYGRDDLARLLDDIGELYLKRKDYEQALVFFRRSAEQYKHMFAREVEASKKEAAESRKSGARLSPGDMSMGGWQHELGRIASVYKTQGRYEKAAEVYEQTAEELRASGNRDAAVRMYLSMAMLVEEDKEAGREETRIALLERGLDRLKELGAEGETSLLYMVLSELYARRKDHERAEALLEKAVATLPAPDEGDEEDDNSIIIVVLYMVRAMRLQAQGDYAGALEEYRKARAVPYKPASEKAVRFFVGIMPAAIYMSQGNEAVGMEMMRRLLPLESMMEESESLPGALSRVCTYYVLTGNDPLAERCFNDAVKLAEEAGDKEATADALGHLVDIYDERKDYERALRHLERQRRLTEKGSDRKEHARTLRRVGDLYREQKLYAGALGYYEQALKANEATDGFSGDYLNDIAETHLLLGDEAKALEAAERAAAAARREGDRGAMWRAQSIAGRAHLALGRRREAFGALDEAIKAIEFTRLHLAGPVETRQLFLDDKITPYHAMIELLVREDRKDEALYYAERSKARLLLDVMQFGRLNLEAALTKEEQASNAQLLSRMAALNVELRQEQLRERTDRSKPARLSRDIQRARLEYEVFQAEIYARHPELQKLPAGAVPITPDEAPALLPGDASAILEFVVTPARTYLFVLTGEQAARGGWEVYRIEVTEEALVERVRRYLDAIAPADQRQRAIDFKAEARDLYDLLLGPAQAQLRGKTALVIVPDGVLWNLPFQALQSPKRRYLLEESAVSYAPSLSVLRQMRGLREARSASATRGRDEGRGALLLAFGDPELGARAQDSPPSARRNRLEPLPETAVEVRSVAELYGAGRSLYLVGPEATEENLKRLAGGYRMLHLATHGLVNDSQPMYSQIVLSKAHKGAGRQPDEDGYLEAREIMRLNLNADLVILSACDTALGRVGNGEGMIGLTWSLSAAGTPTVVASQWAVNSCSTTYLMVEFHRQLRERVVNGASSVGAAEALRRAALSFIRKEAAPPTGRTGAAGAKCRLPAGEMQHPYFWAGFIVIGDGR